MRYGGSFIPLWWSPPPEFQRFPYYLIILANIFNYLVTWIPLKNNKDKLFAGAIDRGEKRQADIILERKNAIYIKPQFFKIKRGL